jgi:glycerol uptake facilitator-like aquaporin
MIGMFIIQLVILETVCHKDSKAGNVAPGIIGIAFFLVILAIAPISGASLNPARSLGPALLSGYFSHLWIFLTAPICGAPSKC